VSVRPSVRPSVCLSVRHGIRPQPQRAARLLLSAVPTGNFNRLRRAAAAGCSTAATQQHWLQHGAQQQMRAVSHLQLT